MLDVQNVGWLRSWFRTTSEAGGTDGGSQDGAGVNAGP